VAAGDLSVKEVVRTQPDAALAQEAVVDTTASMTVNQVVEFWKVASTELLTLIAQRAHLQPGLSNLAHEVRQEKVLDGIAERALRKVFER
jgi:hypothetical protein